MKENRIYLVTPEEMRAYDAYTIEHIGIPSLVLMERAALAVAARVEEALKSRKGKVLCVCGSGNNGGDGLAVVRLLADKGIDADAVFLGNENRAKEETRAQLAILRAYGITPFSSIPEGNYAVVVDAVLGTGLSGEVKENFRMVIETMNGMDAYRIAVDIPSGLDGKTGKALGTAVRADETVTLGLEKIGLCLYPAPAYTGRVILADIGIGPRSFSEKEPEMYTRKDAPAALRPCRRPDGNKGTFGKVFLTAGSGNMAGAALLAGESAYRAGAGMVKLAVPEAIREIVQEKLPEALLFTYGSGTGLRKEEEKAFLENCRWADTLAVGCGLSVCESGRRLLELALSVRLPLLIDADGLNLLAGDENLRELLKRRSREGMETLLTPHMGELARLLGEPVDRVCDSEAESTRAAARRFDCVVAGKSARSYVCGPAGPMFVNTAGNDKMATAGSGDVLLGILAALSAQGMGMREAAETGVYLHACAGDAAARAAAGAGITAGDIIRGLSML